MFVVANAIAVCSTVVCVVLNERRVKSVVEVTETVDKDPINLVMGSF
jgi:hypothetical protein